MAGYYSLTFLFIVESFFFSFSDKNTDLPFPRSGFPSRDSITPQVIVILFLNLKMIGDNSGLIFLFSQ